MPEQPAQEQPLTILCGTRYLELVDRGTWTFARRPGNLKVVAVVALTDKNELVLVEQFRVPVDANVIELPAGLAGDTDDSNESLETAARRELLEETGYSATDWRELATVASSAGLTNEQVTVFRARHLTRESAGGGVDGEDIVVHEIPLCDVESWLKQRTANGAAVDSRVYAALHWAREQ